MTQIRAFGMMDTAETFREGATWYCNGRDWAKEQRYEAIEWANKHVKQAPIVNASFTTAGETCGDGTSTAKSVSQQSHFSFNSNNIHLTESFQELYLLNSAL
jgi:hypothetical protein